MLRKLRYGPYQTVLDCFVFLQGDGMLMLTRFSKYAAHLVLVEPKIVA